MTEAAVLPFRHNSRYAPIRYEATRPYATRLANMYLTWALGGEPTLHQFLTAELVPLLSKELGRMGQLEGRGPIQSEHANVQIYGMYLAGGKTIFDVSKLMSNPTSMGPISEVRSKSLFFPARAFYLHFGPILDLVDEGMTVEGAYVSWDRRDRCLNFDLVRSGSFSVEQFWALPFGDQVLGMCVELADLDQPVEEAFTASMKELVDRMRQNAIEFEAIEKEFTAAVGPVSKIEAPLTTIAAKAGLVEKVFRLIVNTLATLARVEECSEETHQSVHAAAAGAAFVANHRGYVVLPYQGGEVRTNFRNHETVGGAVYEVNC